MSGVAWWLAARVRCPWCYLTAEQIFTDGERRLSARSADEVWELHTQRSRVHHDRFFTRALKPNPNRKRADRFPPKVLALVGEDYDEPEMVAPSYVERWCSDPAAHRYEIKEHHIARAVAATWRVTEIRARRAL